MAFGNEGVTRRRRRPISESTESDTIEDSDPEEEEANQEFNGRIFLLLSMGVLFAGLIFTGPHTYSTKAKVYKPSHVVKSAMAFEKDDERKILSMENSFNFDFSRILTSAQDETSPAMKRLAVSCLPNPPKRPLVAPHMAHRHYSLAKKYLQCAMTKEVDRLCDSSERERLVEQLTQFRERRAEIVSLKRAKAEIKIGKEKGQRLRLVQEVASQRWNTPPGETQLDPKVGNALANLVMRGYISPKDFGYFGLYLPEEFAPYLDQPSKRAPNCG